MINLASCLHSCVNHHKLAADAWRGGLEAKALLAVVAVHDCGTLMKMGGLSMVVGPR